VRSPEIQPRHLRRRGFPSLSRHCNWSIEYTADFNDAVSFLSVALLASGVPGRLPRTRRELSIVRIAEIGPLYEAVPPKLHRGTERVVSFLTEELVALGHDVTLFASGDSLTEAELGAICPRTLRLDPSIRNPFAPHVLLLETARRRAEAFKVMHFPNGLPAIQPFQSTTDAIRDDVARTARSARVNAGFKAFPNVPVVSIADHQRPPPSGSALSWNRPRRLASGAAHAAGGCDTSLSCVPWPHRAGERARSMRCGSHGRVVARLRSQRR
jgi:hypothetical protein